MASVELSGIFPHRNPLEGITASDVGPDIADELGLLLTRPPNVSTDDWPDPERLAEALPDVMP
jgi:hypothetical protein